MSTHRPVDDQDRDAAVDRAWHRASAEEPPSHVDESILAAARSARGQSRRWQPFAAAAAVAGLAAILLQWLPREPEVAAPTRIEPPTAPPAAPRTLERTAPAPAPAEMPGAPRAEASRPAERAATGVASAERATSDLAAAPEAPEHWAARIEALYDAGDLESARAELARFRATDPDADRYLPDALRTWASGVH